MKDKTAAELFEEGAVAIAQLGRKVVLIAYSDDEANTLFKWLKSLVEKEDERP